MRFENFSFGSIHIDGDSCVHDIVLDRGNIRRRKKKTSKRFREEFGHTPLSIKEDIPWKCSQLVIGTGAYGKLPVMPEVRDKAERRKIRLLILPTIACLDEVASFSWRRLRATCRKELFRTAPIVREDRNPQRHASARCIHVFVRLQRAERHSKLYGDGLSRNLASGRGCPTRCPLPAISQGPALLFGGWAADRSRPQFAQ